jgi:hypothetical protein
MILSRPLLLVALLALPVGGQECPGYGCCEFDCCGPGSTWVAPLCLPDPSSGGFDGTFPLDFDPGCVTRDCCEETCCDSGTTYDTFIQCCVADDVCMLDYRDIADSGLTGEGVAESATVPSLTGPDDDALPIDVLVLRDLLVSLGAQFDNHVGYEMSFDTPAATTGLAWHPNESIVNLYNIQPFIAYYETGFEKPYALATWYNNETDPEVFDVRQFLVYDGALNETIESTLDVLSRSPAIVQVNGDDKQVAVSYGISKRDICKAAVTAVASVGSFWALLGCAAGIAAGGVPALIWGTIVTAIEAVDLALGPDAICDFLGY